MSITLALSWLGHDIPEKTLQTYEITVMNSCGVFLFVLFFIMQGHLGMVDLSFKKGGLMIMLLMCEIMNFQACP